MSVQLAFWLLVVFGLAMYAILARSAPDEIAARRRAHTELLRRQKEAERERVVERRAVPRAAPRSGPAARSGGAARSASPTPARTAAGKRQPVRRTSAPTARGSRRKGFAWPFKWPTGGRKRRS